MLHRVEISGGSKLQAEPQCGWVDGWMQHLKGTLVKINK